MQIKAKGRGGLAGSTTQAGSANRRRKPGKPPKAQVKAKNGWRKPGRPKIQPATQIPSAKQLPSTISKQDNDKLVQRTADIVISYAGNNAVSAKQIPEIIENTYAALSGLGPHPYRHGKLPEKGNTREGRGSLRRRHDFRVLPDRIGIII